MDLVDMLESKEGWETLDDKTGQQAGFFDRSQMHGINLACRSDQVHCGEQDVILEFIQYRAQVITAVFAGHT